MKYRGIVSVTALAGLVTLALMCALSTPPASAQDPIGGALATLAAATANAEHLRAVQRATSAAQSAQATQQANAMRALSMQATAQALDAQATAHVQSAQSTAQALDAQATAQAQSVLVTAQAATATQSALDELHRQSAMTATADAQRVTVTAQAIQVRATRSALDAQATRTAYEWALRQSQEQARVGRTLLYGAAVLSLAGTAYVLGHWARALARKASRVSPAPVPSAEIRFSEVLGTSGAQREAQVIDMGAVRAAEPPIPSRSLERMSHIRVIDDPDLVRQAVELFDRLP